MKHNGQNILARRLIGQSMTRISFVAGAAFISKASVQAFSYYPFRLCGPLKKNPKLEFKRFDYCNVCSKSVKLATEILAINKTI